LPSTQARDEHLERELQAPANLPKHGWPALRTALSFNAAERTITAAQLRDALGATSSWLQRCDFGRNGRHSNRERFMFNPANETHFSLTLEDFTGDLQVLSFTGTEGISQPFRFDLELVSENPDLDLEKLLHKQAFLAFDPQATAFTARSTASPKAMPASA
jgi:hypothetical protein